MVKEFRYLGYLFQKNGGSEAQVRDRIKKGAAEYWVRCGGLKREDLEETEERGSDYSTR